MNRTQCDQPAHRFFHRIAQRLVKLAQPKPGDTVLEIAASLEAVTLYTAPTVGPTGKVTTLDLAETAGAQLPFVAATFGCLLCAFAIVLLPGMAAALCEWRRVLKPGGTVAFSGYGRQAMQPLLPLFTTSLRRYGVFLPASIHPFAWQQYTELE